MRYAYSVLAAALLLFAAATAQAAPTIPLAGDGATASSDVDGLCVGCFVADEENVVSSDLTAYATLYTLAGVGGDVSLAVTFPQEMGRGTKAGFVIGNGGLLDVGVLAGLTVTTYRDGEVRDSGSGADLLQLQVLNDGTGRVLLRASKTFDEVEISMAGLVGVARELFVYHAIAFPKPTRRTVTDIAYASEGATVDSDAGGIVCVPVIAPCEVINEDNIIADQNNDFATISLPVGIGAWAWTDVTFPEVNDTKRKVGFVIRDGAGLTDIELLGAMTLTTYLGETEQETAVASDLLRLQLLGGSKKAVYFNARQPFDRVRLRVSGLATIGTQVRVYYAAVQYKEDVSGLVDDASAPIVSAAHASAALPDVLSAPAPNPAASAADLTLRVDQAQSVRVEVYDVRGRLVATPFDGLAAPDAPTALRVDAHSLPSGIYVVRATGETFSATRRLTIAR